MASCLARRLGRALALQHPSPSSSSLGVAVPSLLRPMGATAQLSTATSAAASTTVNTATLAAASPDQPRQTRVLHNITENKPPVPLEPGLEAKFAVINIKSKQYKVTKDDLIISDKVHDIGPGSFLEVEEVHLIGTPEYTLVGRPFVKEGKVRLQVEEQTKDAKVIVFKKKRRKGYRRKKGFRREVTIFRVTDILDQA